jgi:hypothetical protein
MILAGLYFALAIGLLALHRRELPALAGALWRRGPTTLPSAFRPGPE